MADKEAVLSSDDSDDDYVPNGENGNVSEELESGDSESGEDNDKNEPSAKKRRKKETASKEEPVEECNIDVDALWADFKKDADKPEPVNKIEILEPIKTSKPSTITKSTFLLGSSSKGSGGGLASVLGQIGKKAKLSTLEKSKQDWLNFKKAEGIEEEISAHNKGKDGYLEKKDFLQRTDIRQFEIEKEMRTLKRSTR